MAEEMRADAMEHIHDYLATQLIMQSSSSKPTLRTRRGEGQDKVGKGGQGEKGRAAQCEHVPFYASTLREKRRVPHLASNQEGLL